MATQILHSARRGQRPWTLTEAKAKFSSLVDSALKGEPQHVIRNGREEVIILDAVSYKRILRPKRSLTKLFSALQESDIELDRPQSDSREAPRF